MAVVKLVVRLGYGLPHPCTYVFPKVHSHKYQNTHVIELGTWSNEVSVEPVATK